MKYVAVTLTVIMMMMMTKASDGVVADAVCGEQREDDKRDVGVAAGP